MVKNGEKIEVYTTEQGELRFNVVTDEYGHNCSFKVSECAEAMRYLIASPSERDNFVFETGDGSDIQSAGLDSD